MYYSLTGQIPYSGDSEVDIGIKHFTSPIPILPAMYQCFQNIINKALAKSPNDRYQSAAEFAEAVGEVSIGNLATLVQSINDDSEALTHASKTPKTPPPTTTILSNLKTTVISAAITATVLLCLLWVFTTKTPFSHEDNSNPVSAKELRLYPPLTNKPTTAIEHTKDQHKQPAIKPATLTCTYKLLNSWGDGWQGQILLNNTSNQTITNWRISFPSPQNGKITNSYSSKIGRENKITVLSPHEWSKKINAQSTLKLEFQGNGTAPNQLNSLHCNG